MYQISFDSNSIINTVSILLIVLTLINYILSINVNRKQRRKLEELDDALKNLYKLLS